MLTKENARQIALAWIEAWNARDLERVLSHYAVNCRFTSPRAAHAVGRTDLSGRDELRKYWEKVLRSRERLEFRLDGTVWDEAQQSLVIVYFNAGDSGVYRAVELMNFDNDGLVVRGEALYGAMVGELQ